MPAYLIFHYTIHDPETFAKYEDQARSIAMQYGMKPIIITGRPELPEHQVLEGQPQYQGIAIGEFESEETAKRFYESPEFQAITHLRTSSAEGWLVIAPGFQMPG